MKNFNKIHCFHHTDADGLTSASILYNVFPDAIFHSLNYYDDFEEKVFTKIDKNDIVYMLDISMSPITKMIELQKKCKLLVWIDHHYQIINEAMKNNFNPPGIRGEFSTCKLTWIYFYGDKKIPRIIELVNEWDTHVSMSEDSVNFNYYIENFKPAPDSDFFKNLLNIYEDIYPYIEKGKFIRTILENEMIKRVKSNGILLNFSDYKVLLVNGYVDLDVIINNDVLDKNSFDFLIMFERKIKGWQFSLRSKYVDVSKICSLFNGGGHKYASGFFIDDDRFIEKLLNGKILIK